METDDVNAEPAVDRWTESKPASDRKDGAASGLPFFRLSGGLMKSSTKTSNRIDGLLMRMMEHPSSGGYRPNLDGNLDYLLTSLQLDMIEMLANDYSETVEEPSVDLELPDPEDLELSNDEE